jgi:hypothetical protein
MDYLMRLLQYIPSEIGMLVAWIVFITGFGGGILFAAPFKKRMIKNFAEDISFLQNELRNVDAEVGRLWSMTFPANHHRVSASPIPTRAIDPKLSAAADLINARKMLESLAANIKSITHNLESRLVRNSETGRNMYAPIPVTTGDSRQHYRSQSDHSPAPHHPVEDTYEVVVESETPVVDNTPDAMVHLYNRAVNDTFAREQFRDHYCPIRIGTVNAVERRQNPTIKAEIRETTDGDFFALAIPGSNEFAVFPRFGLTIEAVSYGAGAIGEVFDKTQGHDPKLFYSHYRVKRPAIFRLEGGHWCLWEPGELELGFGE